MSALVWYLPYFEGVFHMVRMLTNDKNVRECKCTNATYVSYYVPNSAHPTRHR